VQVDPIKPKLKPPGTKRLKIKCDILLSAYPSNFNSRRYTEVSAELVSLLIEAEAYTRPLLSSI